MLRPVMDNITLHYDDEVITLLYIISLRRIKVVPVITLAIVIGVLVFIAYPLLPKRVAEVPPESLLDDETEELLFKKETTLAAIKELEFDYKTGKLSEEDYSELLKKYEGEALNVLEEIEKDENVEKRKEGRKKTEKGDLETQIEEEIKAAREDEVKTKGSKKKKVRFCSQCGESYKQGEKFCSNCGALLTVSKKKPLVCESCGQAYQKGDKFCPHCGEKPK